MEQIAHYQDENIKRTKKHAWLETHIGSNRKILVVNYSKNTGMNFEEYTKKLIDRDVRENPELYSPPKDLAGIIKSQNSLEDKIWVIFRAKRSVLSLRHITTILTKCDKTLDRSILRILAQKILESNRFYKTKVPNKKYVCYVYGLTEWLNNKK